MYSGSVTVSLSKSSNAQGIMLSLCSRVNRNNKMRIRHAATKVTKVTGH